MFQVLNTNTIKPGKGGAFIQVEMRDIKSGNKINERFRTSENIEKLSVNEISATFLFIDNSNITVMKNDDYEQISLDESLLVGSKEFLADGTQLSLELIGDEIVGIKLPKSIVVEIESADAVVKGQTASSSFKKADTFSDEVRDLENLLLPTDTNLSSSIGNFFNFSSIFVFK